MGRLTDDQVASAADVLVRLREGRVVASGLPAEVTPDNTADIQRIIDAVSDRVERPIRGWKSYTLYKPMNPPFCAPIYDVFPNGAEIPSHISPTRLIEPEIMFRIDRDMTCAQPRAIGTCAKLSFAWPIDRDPCKQRLFARESRRVEQKSKTNRC